MQNSEFEMTNVFWVVVFTIFFTDFLLCFFGGFVGLFHTRSKTSDGHKKAESIAYVLVKFSENMNEHMACQGMTRHVTLCHDMNQQRDIQDQITFNGGSNAKTRIINKL